MEAIGAGPSYAGSGFNDIGNSRGISYIIKTLRGDAHAAIRYIAAKQHRGGAKVSKPLVSEGLVS